MEPAQGRSIAVVVVSKSDDSLEKARTELARQPSGAGNAAVFALQPPGARVQTAAFKEIHALSPEQLGLPDRADYPFRYTFASWAVALFPWIAEHLFNDGFQQVVCLDLQPPQEGDAEPSQESALIRAIGALKDDLDLVLADDQSAGAMRNTPAVRQYLQYMKQQRLEAARNALHDGLILFGIGSGAMPEALRGRMCLMPANQTVSATAPLKARPLASLSTEERNNSDLNAAARLHYLYAAILQRPPDKEGLLQFAPRMSSPWGALRVATGLARTPGASLKPSRWGKVIRATLGIVRPTTSPQVNPGDAHGARDVNLERPLFRCEAPVVLPAALPRPSGINLAGYIRAELGLGEAARSLAQACFAAQIEVSLVDLGYQTLHPQTDHPLQRHGLDRYHAIDLHYVNASHAAQTADFLKTHGLNRNSYTIGFWHWEQPELPRDALAAFRHLDEVWAPSTFVADAIAAVAPIPVFKVPHAVEFEPSPGLTRARFGLPTDRVLVLVMYDFLSYQHRKNPEAALAAFRLAARQHPELALVIKTINGHRQLEALLRLKASVADLPNTTFIETFLSRQDTWNLQACCDILLSLHRAEGFGLAPAEMMRLGKAVVATGWSANMDFMTDANSMPVRFRLVPLAHDVGAYPAGPVWAEADVEHAAWCLCRLVEDPLFKQQIGQQAATDIKLQLSPKAVGERIRLRLSVLGHWYPQLLTPPQLDPRFQALSPRLKSEL